MSQGGQTEPRIAGASSARHQRVVSASARTRIEAARAWLLACDPASPVTLVAPSLQAGARLVHGLPAGSGRFGLRRFTMDSLVDTLALRSMAVEGLAPAKRASQRALVARALEAVRMAGQLGQLTPVADRPGLVEAVRSSLSDLRDADATTQALASITPELCALLESYTKVADEAALADAARRTTLARQAVERGEAELAQYPLLVFDVPLWRPRERALVRALLARVPAALVVTAQGDAETLEVLSGLSPATCPPETRPRLFPLHDGLFREDGPALPSEVATRVHWMTCAGEARECVEVARAMRDAAREGLAFDAMAVVLRSPETYRAPLEEALDRAGIPAYFARGARRPEPAGRALLVLLRCAREGLSARAFAEYLSLGQAPFDEEGGDADDAAEVASAEPAAPLPPASLAPYADAPKPPSPSELLERARGSSPRPIVPRRFERFLVESSVVGGLPRWKRRLSGLLAEKQRLLDDPTLDGAARSAIEREEREIETLCALSMPLLERLDALPARGSWHTWLEALHALSDAALREPAVVHEALDELAPLGGIDGVAIDEVLRVLEGHLGEAFRPSAGLGAGKVFVGGIDDVIGMSFSLVCVPGLTEKVFPQKDLEDPLLLDERRAKLGLGLATRADRLSRERLRLRMAVGAAEDTLWLSYPRVDSAAGKPRVPSLYALELLRLREGELLGLSDLLQRAESGGAARLGWPAPEEPEQAIDETEYDLSVLASVLGRDPDASKGEARYLVESHPVLGRALRFRAKRWGAKWTTADGLVVGQGDPDAGAALASHRLSARAYAPTALEAFAACPYRFYLRAVMGLSPRADLTPIESLDPAQWGQLFHAVQRELLVELRDTGLLPLGDASLAEANARLEAVLAREIERAREQLAPAIDHVFEDAARALSTDLRQWLAGLAADAEWVPAYFELGFGLSAREPLDPHSRSEAVEVDGARLRGAIDMVEQHRDDARRLRATDHKTGSDSGALSVVQGGERLQPVLYALALEQIFPGAKVEGGRLHFCTGKGGFRSREVRLDAHARKTASEVLRTIDGMLSRGFLPAKPRPGACEHCDYRSVCGPYEEQRTAHKAQLAWLGPLARVRGFR